MATAYRAPNPFNPSVPATIRNFVGREPAIKEFEQKLQFVKNGSPMGLAISGDWGIGKTSLLIKYEGIAQLENSFIVKIGTVSPDIDSQKKLAWLIISSIQLRCKQLKSLGVLKDDLDIFTDGLANETHRKEMELTFGSSIDSTHQTILRDFLESFWARAKQQFAAIIILIDEVDRIVNLQNYLLFLREVFQRLSESQANYFLVISGRKILSEQMSGEFAPLLRFFYKVQLDNFAEVEAADFIELRLSNTGVTMDDNVKKKLFEETEGHPYVLSVAMMILYRELPETDNKITMSYYHAFEPEVFNYISNEFFLVAYNSTTPAARKILRKLADMPYGILRFSEIVSHIGGHGSEVSPYLAELVRKGCLTRVGRGEYKFFHKLFKRFVEMQDASKIKPRKVNRSGGQKDLSTWQQEMG